MPRFAHGGSGVRENSREHGRGRGEIGRRHGGGMLVDASRRTTPCGGTGGSERGRVGSPDGRSSLETGRDAGSGRQWTARSVCRRGPGERHAGWASENAVWMWTCECYAIAPSPSRTSTARGAGGSAVPLIKIINRSYGATERNAECEQTTTRPNKGSRVSPSRPSLLRRGANAVPSERMSVHLPGR
ncbi:hypothetical protein L227DRAFT_368643 [Lentinus tigrinus ALCF2SS1-6]|uniref:Uncharacterized protein n=1 Tax=Lentinus tigrinus ALCF2SS1-6 TaxID=1328759 RepID=A0A5C2RU30_9APHY|nr:hypothetical protein L227DRAFT_368643 [Lentinus tigrinus ALCF2SS1-6]